MRAVLMSVSPKEVEAIANGVKTLILKKTKPKLETPFKVYIYCTKNKRQWLRKVGTSVREIFITENIDVLGRTDKVKAVIGDEGTFWENGGYNGRAIGEFVCDSIETLSEKDLFYGMDELSCSRIEEYSCADLDELLRYKGTNENLYGWGISNLVIYDKPKELSEFSKTCDNYWRYDDYDKCYGCDYYYCDSNPSCGREEGCYCDGNKPITRPPQSWCYVEECKK